MKIIFAGSPAFAVTILQALISSSHEIVAVFTQADKPSGRGLKLTPSPVKILSETHQLAVYQPLTLKDDSIQLTLKNLQADVMIVAAYGLLLPAAVLSIPRHGCINIHPSLLPRWRGAAPIQRTVHAGDKTSGVTIMQMDPGLDTGPILLQKTCELASDETSQTLQDKLARLSATAILESLDLLSTNKLTASAQDNALATYASKISKEEAMIDWQDSAQEIDREVRAFNPWPIAYTSWQGQTLRVWRAQVLSTDNSAKPRTILHASQQGIDIATGKGVLRLLDVQLPGGKILSANDFYNAKHDLLIVGEHLI